MKRLILIGSLFLTGCAGIERAFDMGAIYANQSIQQIEENCAREFSHKHGVVRPKSLGGYGSAYQCIESRVAQRDEYLTRVGRVSETKAARVAEYNRKIEEENKRYNEEQKKLKKKQSYNTCANGAVFAYRLFLDSMIQKYYQTGDVKYKNTHDKALTKKFRDEYERDIKKRCSK